MATVAGDTHMCTGEWEPGYIVIQIGRLPTCSRVALCTLLRKSSRDVIRVARRCIIAFMTGNAASRRSRESSRVAVVARDRSMSAGQWEVRDIMIVFGGCPICCRMATRAFGRESGRGMIRVGSRCVVSLVTRVAIR
jgi:hypothetical protein